MIESHKKAIIIFAIAWIVMQIIMTVKPFGIEQIEAISPGTKILELQFNYSPENAHKTLGQFGEVGRIAYSKLILIDFIYIIVYTFLFSFCIKALVSFYKIDKKLIGKIWILPILGGGLDIFENVFNLVQISTFPGVTFILYALSNVITMCKYVITLSYEGITAIGFIGYLFIITISKLTKNTKNVERSAQENERA